MLVSCLMPTTAARIPWLPLSLACWKRQTYKHRELVVVTEDVEVADAVLAQTDGYPVRVMVKRCDTVGEKFNVLHQKARGELHCYWADDDWQRDDAIELRARLFDKEGVVEKVGSPSMLFWDIYLEQMHRLTRPPGKRAWCPHGSVMVRRNVWQRNRYPARQVGSDAAWQDADKRVRTVLVESGWYVAMRHGRNNWQTDYSAPCWSRSAVQLADVLGDDMKLLPGLNHGRTQSSTRRPA